MSTPQTDEPTAEVRKNTRELVRVRPVTYHGHELLDVRAWVPGILPGDEAKPTRKGLTLSPDLWRELLPLIRVALDE